MNPQVSIIVPMHNSASTIVRCVDSILSQVGCKSLEIILVDDGSTDSTILTVEEAYGILFGNSRTFHYQDYDVRLCFTGHKDCHGVSFARNSGIKKASGQWLTFVDSDDFIGENHIANLLNCAVKNNADIAWSGYSNFDVATEESHKSEIIFDDNEVLDSEKYKKYFFSCSISKFSNADSIVLIAAMYTLLLMYSSTIAIYPFINLGLLFTAF